MPQSMSLARQEDTNMRCDWIGCLEVGFFDGVQKTVLNAEGRKNITETRRTFVVLCPEHVMLSVGNGAHEKE